MNLEALKGLGLTTLRLGAVALGLTGNVSAARQLNRIADGAEAGLDVDADMAAAAALLGERKLDNADWDAEFAAISDESDKFQDRDAPADPPPG